MSLASPRVRHLVLMVEDLDATADRLRTTFGLLDPFPDPIAGEFGLRNQIFALGDTFVEVCQPVSPDAAGQRHLDRAGEGGYMVIFQVPDLDVARGHVDAAGARVVWEGARPGIRGMHLHPRDVPGTIMSLDEATPADAWPWGGPAWDAGPGPSAPLDVAAIEIGVRDPDAVARRWATVLGLPEPAHDDATALPVAAGPTVRLVADDRQSGLRAITLRPRDGRAIAPVRIGGVRFDGAAVAG